MTYGLCELEEKNTIDLHLRVLCTVRVYTKLPSGFVTNFEIMDECCHPWVDPRDTKITASITVFETLLAYHVYAQQTDKG